MRPFDHRQRRGALPALSARPNVCCQASWSLRKARRIKLREWHADCCDGKEGASPNTVNALRASQMKWPYRSYECADETYNSQSRHQNGRGLISSFWQILKQTCRKCSAHACSRFPPSCSRIWVRCLWIASKIGSVSVSAPTEARVPTSVEARQIIAAFHLMVDARPSRWQAVNDAIVNGEDNKRKIV